MRDAQPRRGVRGIDADDARSRRAESNVELRKAKKDDVLSKRRNFAAVEHASTLGDTPSTGQPAVPTVADIPVLARDALDYVRGGCRNDQTAAALQTIIKLRKLLSIPVGPPIDEVLC
jgi:importin subunit alpha-2